MSVPWGERQQQQLAAMVAAGIPHERIAGAFGVPVEHIAARIAGETPPAPVEQPATPPAPKTTGGPKTKARAPRPAEPRRRGRPPGKTQPATPRARRQRVGRPRVWAPNLIEQAIALLAAGRSYAEIGAELDRSEFAVRSALRRHRKQQNGTGRERAHTKWSDELKAAVERLRAAGLTYRRIAETLGMTEIAVRVGANKYGLKRKRGGES